MPSARIEADAAKRIAVGQRWRSSIDTTGQIEPRECRVRKARVFAFLVECPFSTPKARSTRMTRTIAGLARKPRSQ